MAKKQQLEKTYFRVPLDPNDIEDAVVLKLLLSYASDKRAYKIRELLYKAVVEEESTPTEKKLLDIVENFSKSPISSVSYVPNSKPIIPNSTPSPSILSTPSTPIALGDLDMSLDFLQQTAEMNNEDITKKYMHEMYKKNTEEYSVNNPSNV